MHKVALEFMKGSFFPSMISAHILEARCISGGWSVSRRTVVSLMVRIVVIIYPGYLLVRCGLKLRLLGHELSSVSLLDSDLVIAPLQFWYYSYHGAAFKQCRCGHPREDVCPYLVHCPNWVRQRQLVFRSVHHALGCRIDITVHLLLGF